MTAAEVSFAKASELLAALAGVEVETRQVERCAEALGREIARDECAVREQTAPAPAPTMYLGPDGTGVPVRPTEVAGRRGKQPNGSAKTREVKLATAWTAEGPDAEGRPCRDRGSVSYNAAVETAASRDTDPQPAAFPQRAHRESQRRGFFTAARQVVLGNGAPWIWNLADEHFPDAIQIVDIYHAKQHLCDVAKAIHGPGRSSPTSGHRTGRPSWTPDASETWSRRCAPTSTRRRRASASSTSPATATGCAIRSSGPKACACPRASSRPGANRSAHGPSAPACAGPSPAPTPSSPCAAASSAAASRTSGSDEPRRPPDAIQQWCRAPVS